MVLSGRRVKGVEGKKDAWYMGAGTYSVFYAVRENKPFVMNVYRCVSRERSKDI